MSSQFLTFIFIILVSVQLSSCGWSFPLKNDKQEESSIESTTEKSFKDDEPNSSPRELIESDDSDLPQPKIYLESTSGSSVQSTIITTPRNVPKVPNAEWADCPEEESSESPNSEKEIKAIPTTSTSSTDKIVNYGHSMVHWLVLVQTAVSWAIQL